MILDFRDYLNYAEKYLMRAEDDIEKSIDAYWLLIPATILAWSAIESFVNNRLDDFDSLPEGIFALHEKAFLTEKRVKFIDRGDKIGQFVLEGTEYRRLEDKIFFLIRKFGKPGIRNQKGEILWQNFQDFKNARDTLAHPRRDKEIDLDVAKVRKFIEISKEVIQLVSEHVWNKKITF